MNMNERAVTSRQLLPFQKPHRPVPSVSPSGGTGADATGAEPPD
jgi:hypothetical protein